MKISEVNIYPVKSLSGCTLTESVVEKRGLRFDRRWMLTDADGRFLTQREHPLMARISVRIMDEELAAGAEGFGEIRIPFEPVAGEMRQVTVWNSTVEGLMYSGAVNEWFGEVLGANIRLVRMPESSERHVSERFDRGADIVSFADGYPVLLIGEGSLEELNGRIAEEFKGGGEFVPLEMRRFRPNLVVAGAEPFAEDGWAQVRIGEAEFRVVKPCARCVVTTIDPDRGEVDGKEPLRTLATFRKASDVFPETYEEFGFGATSVLFGENLIPEFGGAAVRAGDGVEVLEKRV
jgi:uncharacterized protein